MMLAKSRSRPIQRIDTSALPFGQAPRIRSKAHRKWINEQRCCVMGCGSRFSQCHHLLSGPEPKARSEKASDTWCLPLCGFHHSELHSMGDERAWGARHNIDLIATAAEFWRRSPANKPTSP